MSHESSARPPVRSREQGVVDGFVRGVAAGGSGALLVVGEPGAGASTLLAHAEQAATALGHRVLTLPPPPLRAPYPPCGALLALLAPVLDQADPGQAAALAAPLSRSSDSLLPATTVTLLMRRAAADRPLLLVVDDTSRLDPHSARALSFAARRLTGTAAGLIAASRSGQPDAFDRAGLPELALAPPPDACSPTPTLAWTARSNASSCTPRRATSWP